MVAWFVSGRLGEWWSFQQHWRRKVAENFGRKSYKLTLGHVKLEIGPGEEEKLENHRH